ncbi:MAG: FMN-binding protein [Acidobacteriota bacterium]|nr:FMN-binding protein [Acidobacteriota bacterium]MDH3522896.1 FMN-binding protein [Acidobacteriota bacterium]
MGRSTRKAVRFLHLAVNGAWLGTVLSTLVLVAAGSPEAPAPYLAAFWLHDNLAVWAAAVVLFTGLYFSLYTPWGLVKKWWVAAKWLGLAVLGLGLPFAVAPVTSALAAHADLALATGRHGAGLAALERRALLLLAAEGVVLVLLFIVSTWRPGRDTGLRWEERRFVRPALIATAVVVVAASALGSAALERARRTPLPRVALAGLAEGSREARIDWLGVEIAVRVELAEGRIRRLRILEMPAGHYPALGALVVEKVEAAGDLEVDGVSGATTSARGVLVAAAEALAAH